MLFWNWLFLSLYGVLTRRQDNIPILDIYETSIEYQYWAPESITCKDFDMKNKTLFRIAIIQLLILFLFMFLTLGNEIIDIPNYVLNDIPTSFSQRTGEVAIELSIFIIVMALQIWLFTRLYKRIKILEGFISICANCKKIRNSENKWEQMEKYVTEHSLAQFSHGICPDCAKELYPNLHIDTIKSPNE